MKRISIPSTKRIGEDMLMLFHFDRRKKSEKEKKPPRFLVLRRKWLTLGAAVLAAAAIFAAVNYPAAVSASAATRQLPIYCVQRDQKVCSISFDAAWGADNTQKILDVLKEYGVTAAPTGENAAWGSVSPQEVVDAWMQSEGHRANILNPEARAMGVGYYYNSSSTWGHQWIQIFTK